jgi:hypothetical protein
MRAVIIGFVVGAALGLAAATTASSYVSSAPAVVETDQSRVIFSGPTWDI